jgi:hypothetical protein
VSCGCWGRENLQKTVEKQRIRGVAAAKRKEERRQSREIDREWQNKGPNLKQVYRNMMARCYRTNHPNYARHGGRGITVCPEWRESMRAFALWALDNGYQEGLRFGRIDYEKGYSPENCRWTDAHATNSNRSHGNAVYLNYAGERKTIAEWSRDPRINLGAGTISYRHRAGWSDSDALTVPSVRGNAEPMNQ